MRYAAQRCRGCAREESRHVWGQRLVPVGTTWESNAPGGADGKPHQAEGYAVSPSVRPPSTPGGGSQEPGTISGPCVSQVRVDREPKREEP